MKLSANDSVFAGSIPELYDRYMVPMIFEPYAQDLCERIVPLRPADVLELAAGTGVVTRHLARALPAHVAIVATDLNQPMLDQAQRVGTERPVTWRQADAQQLPFADAAFDVVACQFGVMFFPDKPRAHGEVKRVLRPGGSFVFNVWDRCEANDFIDIVNGALDEVFPDQPPRFMQRGPHGYADPGTIRADLAQGGFTDVQVVALPKRSRADDARQAAVAYCQGTPLRLEIEARGPDALARATDAATQALARRYGAGPVEGAIQALVVLARKG
jgi:SAM-dependent methyltransferase